MVQHQVAGTYYLMFTKCPIQSLQDCRSINNLHLSIYTYDFYHKAELSVWCKYIVIWNFRINFHSNLASPTDNLCGICLSRYLGDLQWPIFVQVAVHLISTSTQFFSSLDRIIVYKFEVSRFDCSPLFTVSVPSN